MRTAATVVVMGALLLVGLLAAPRAEQSTAPAKPHPARLQPSSHRHI